MMIHRLGYIGDRIHKRHRAKEVFELVPLLDPVLDARPPAESRQSRDDFFFGQYWRSRAASHVIKWGINGASMSWYLLSFSHRVEAMRYGAVFEPRNRKWSI